MKCFSFEAGIEFLSVIWKKFMLQRILNIIYSKSRPPITETIDKTKKRRVSLLLFFIPLVRRLTTLSVWRLYSIDDDYEAAGGMRIPRETQVLGKYMPWYNLVHHTSHMT
jgi:hypothetical protein